MKVIILEYGDSKTKTVECKTFSFRLYDNDGVIRFVMPNGSFLMKQHICYIEVESEEEG